MAMGLYPGEPPFGTKAASSTASALTLRRTGSTVTLRDAFSGKEDQQPDFGVPWLDFGARAYSPSLRRWMVPDPLGEKYYGVNPYAYCNGDPVNYVDPEGMTNFIVRDSTYTVNDGHDESLSVSEKDYRKIKKRFDKHGADIRYEMILQKYLDKAGYLTSTGEIVLPAAFSIDYRSYKQWLHGLNTLNVFLSISERYSYDKSSYYYSEKRGTWTGKNGKTYQMNVNGNQYTGGRIKYAKSKSIRFKRTGKMLGRFGSASSVYAFISNDDIYQKTAAASDIIVDAFGSVPYAGPIITGIWLFGGQYFYETRILPVIVQDIFL